ncbi:MAG: type II secretion system F family protein, partial [Candidatus Altiarchaeales archaeon]|nr:type II secretion system F family protein [Candidatus Altiarchaeales archaeon]
MRDIVSRVYPSGIKSHVNQLLLYNGVEFGVERVLALITGIILGISCILALLLSKEFVVSFSAIFFPLVAVLILAVYSAPMLLADSRGRFVEGILPDVLKLMSSNLRAGLTIDRSLINAARPEFGFFQKEISQVAGKIVSGKTLEEALSELSTKIKSKNLETTIDLIIQGIRSGGSLAGSLDRIADIL